jgi:hypothetical protein
LVFKDLTLRDLPFSIQSTLTLSELPCSMPIGGLR